MNDLPSQSRFGGDISNNGGLNSLESTPISETLCYSGVGNTSRTFFSFEESRIMLNSPSLRMFAEFLRWQLWVSPGRL